MTKIFNTTNLKKIYILTFILLCSNLTKAQPGWQDFTARYFYTILGENGKEISFKQNKNYSIMIDSVLYKSPNIPQDSLKPAEYNSNNFEIHIRINDFSLAIPMMALYESQKRLEIKVIYKKDTMFIFPTPTDLTLQFIAGHYYFPNWTKRLLENTPKASGDVKIINIDQRHFIIPKTAYQAIWQKHTIDAEKLVVDNFMKGYFSFERSSQPTTFDRSVLPFLNTRWRTYFPTNERDVFVGVVDFSSNTMRYPSGRGMLVRFNYKENKMYVWSASDNLLYSSTYKLRKDFFNNVYYHQTILRDTTCKGALFYCDYEIKFYCSTDEGKTWEESEELTLLNKKHEIRELEFLDHNHILLFKRDKIIPKNNKFGIQQGTYYLLKDFQIIDSLKSPNDIHYNDNYNRYGFDIKNDTIFLGSWSYSKFQVEKPYVQPSLVKIDGKWKFQVVEKTYFRTKPNREEIDTIAYQNFKILNNNELVFRNNGSLTLQDDLYKLHNRGLILENGKQIYLIGLTIGTLLSFDGGVNWYVYPLPLEKGSRYEFLEINEQGVVSHLKNSWGENGNEFNKVFNQFLKLDE